MSVLEKPATSPVPTAADTAANKQIASRAQHELLVDKDFSAIDRYFADPYIQHNPHLPNGLTALKEFKAANVPAATTEILRCLGDRDLVFIQNRVQGLMPDPLPFWDLYRLEGGLIVEHWDCWQASASVNASGRTPFDGTAAITDVGQTESTRALITTLVNTVFVAGQRGRLAEFLHPELVQHGPGMADGATAWAAHLKTAQWFTGHIEYHALRRVVAEGDFAMTAAQGAIGSIPHALYDLWRVAGDQVVEHWSCSKPVEASPFHSNPAV